jgi:putative transposase
MRVCKRTIQKYMRQLRTQEPRGQKWATFVHHHAAQIWACDFIQVTDLFFRPLFTFFLIELKSRKVMHVGVTRSPTDPWVAQHLREATPYGQAPKYLMHDNDSKFGSCFVRVATTSGIEILKTPYHAPRANAICERFPRSVRRACLDHLLILHERQHEPRPQCVCSVLQPGTTASRHPAADSRILWIISFYSARRNQGGCCSDLGRAAP